MCVPFFVGVLAKLNVTKRNTVTKSVEELGPTLLLKQGPF